MLDVGCFVAVYAGPINGPVFHLRLADVQAVEEPPPRLFGENLPRKHTKSQGSVLIANGVAFQEPADDLNTTPSRLVGFICVYR